MIVVRPSRIHATGCFATQMIPAGTRIVEYTGPRITNKEADDKYDGAERTYLFGLEDGKHVIDGDGIAAYINHSCEPNCEPEEILGRVWIFALRDIKRREELTYDYNLFDGDLDDKASCQCNSKKCRGSMYSPEEIDRRKKKLARKKKR